MAPLAKKVSNDQWERHKDAIHRLYHVRRLPLHSKDGKPNVLQIMRKEHNFHASLSQFETYLRKTDQPKNLKRSEWRAIHTKLEEFSDLGIKTRVKVSGQILTKDKIERSRRYVLSEKPSNDPPEEPSLPPSHRATIEVLGTDEKWTPYSSNNAPGVHLPASTDNHITVDPEVPDMVADDSVSLLPDLASITESPLLSSGAVAVSPKSLSLGTHWHEYPAHDDDSYLPEQPRAHRSVSARNSPFFGSLMSPLNGSLQFDIPEFSVDTSGPGLFDLDDFQIPGPSPLVVHNTFGSHTTFISQHLPSMSSFSELQWPMTANSMTKTDFGLQSTTYNGVPRGMDLAHSNDLQIHPRTLARSLLYDASQVLIKTVKSNGGEDLSRRLQNLPDADDVVNSLLSMLPESWAEHGSLQTPEVSITIGNYGSSFHRALIFSVANGFAGLGNIPPEAILSMLKKQHELRKLFFHCLESFPTVLAKSLAENLFRRAVETCDEEIVRVILETTQNTPNEIDPNSVICIGPDESRGAEGFTPIEISASFGHLGIVKLLLAAKADVNKGKHGAIKLAIQKENQRKETIVELVTTLLDHGAEVQVGFVDTAMQDWAQTTVAEALVSRLPPAKHTDFFSSSYHDDDEEDYNYDTLLLSSARFQKNESATKIIAQLFQYCSTAGCNCCSADHPDLMSKTLGAAARRGNIDLVHFLLPLTLNKDLALTAAVRNGSRTLIDLFLEHGASVGGITYLDKGDPKYPAFFNLPTSPLAEAIRSQNKNLIREFENLGALSYIHLEKHFDAALFAAAEVGDCDYIQTLFKREPKKKEAALSSALALAVYNKKIEAAVVLLDNGARVNNHAGIRVLSGFNSPLAMALRMQNMVLVDKFLEAYLDDSGDDGRCMILAALWGDISIVKDLIRLGHQTVGWLGLTPLSIAVKTRNTPLVELLLKYGADPNNSNRRKFRPESATTRPDNPVHGVEWWVTPLEAAIINNDNDMKCLLVSHGADPADHDAFLASIEKSPEAFNSLLNIFCRKYPRGKVNFGGGLIIEAIRRADEKWLSSMLSAKFDVNELWRKKRSVHVTALWVAIMHRKGMDLRVVQRLFDAGVDPNAICRRLGHRIETGLIAAIYSKSEQMVRLLLRNGADLHQPARRGLKRTALQEASKIGSFEVAKLLIDEGANVNEPPAFDSGGTALQFAAINGDIRLVKLLLSNGASVHALPSRVNGRTALEGAAENARLEMIRVLWNAVAGQGFTHQQIEKAARLADGRGHRGCAEYVRGLSPAADFLLL